MDRLNISRKSTGSLRLSTRIFWIAITALIATLLSSIFVSNAFAQQEEDVRVHTLFDLPPRVLVDMPTAGTLPRGNFDIGLRLYDQGGALGYTDIGLSSRLQLGVSFGGVNIISSSDPKWNPRIGFSAKLRIIDELEVFPALAIGFTDQGFGAYSEEYQRYTYKSRGFYAVVTRSFYFYKWTSSWHLGTNYSLEYDGDHDEDVDIFGGFDITFDYNLGIFLEYDAALNDDRGSYPEIAGRGRGYLNLSLKWLFARNLELEFIAKDLLVNRRQDETFSRGMRILYIDSF